MWREGASFPGLKIIKVRVRFCKTSQTQLIECKVGTMDDPNALANAKPGAELYAPTRVSWVAPIEGAEQKQAMS